MQDDIGGNALVQIRDILITVKEIREDTKAMKEKLWTYGIVAATVMSSLSILASLGTIFYLVFKQ